MPEPNNKTKHSDDNEGVKIREDKSSLAEFTRRPLPTEEEMEDFENFVGEEAREEGIEESLNEIYQDGKGGIVDVKRLDIKKRHGFFFWFFTPLIIIGSLAGAGYAAYYYFYQQPGSDATAVEFTLDGKNEIVAGEEFFYTIHYQNLSNININDVGVAVAYPDNFIFLDSFPESQEKNSIWEFSSIPARRHGKIKIKGTMIGQEDETGIILANLIYTPENFSSQFKKETSLTTVIKDIGLDFDFDYVNSALVGEENEIKVKFRGKENNYINNFRLIFEPQENIEFVSGEGDKEEKVKYSLIRPGIWQINEVTDEEQELLIKFKFREKLADSQEIILNFEQEKEDSTAAGPDQTKSYEFYTKTLNFEVMKSDLNLTLIINGSRNDQGVDFGQTLNYSIVYKNKGETELKDVVIMAVLESDFLGWTTLEDALGGKEKGNTISWSKEEIPGLEVLARNEEGTIDFFIKLMELGEIELDKDYQVKSYAQFSVGETEETAEEAKEDTDRRSNTVINKINSDLTLDEQVRYFNDDNIPVGTGPHPPKVDEATSYKVYWNLSNTLHELDDLKITVVLPDYVAWGGKDQVTVGTIQYNNETGAVVWDIGRLPITVYQAMAEFSIRISPGEENRNKIMVLLPGTLVQAIDQETKTTISQTTKAKTTKLEDDDIASGDGIVE
jgi:uncharacterized repeat protein (TIGR01451 family)